MSITRQVTVWCDDCSNWEQVSTTVAKLRKELKSKGWVYLNKKDYCPECAQLRGLHRRSK